MRISLQTLVDERYAMSMSQSLLHNSVVELFVPCHSRKSFTCGSHDVAIFTGA